MYPYSPLIPPPTPPTRSAPPTRPAPPISSPLFSPSPSPSSLCRETAGAAATASPPSSAAATVGPPSPSSAAATIGSPRPSPALSPPPPPPSHSRRPLPLSPLPPQQRPESRPGPLRRMIRSVRSFFHRRRPSVRRAAHQTLLRERRRTFYWLDRDNARHQYPLPGSDTSVDSSRESPANMGSVILRVARNFDQESATNYTTSDCSRGLPSSSASSSSDSSTGSSYFPEAPRPDPSIVGGRQY